MRETITRRGTLRALGVTGGIALAGCTGGGAGNGGGSGSGSGGGNENDPGEGEPTATAEPVDADETVTVGPGGDLVYDPEELRVDVGATVAWVWDSGGHTVTVERQPPGAGWRGTNLSTKEAGYVLTETFDIAGTYEYYCTPHQSAGMSATLVVGGSDETATEDGGTETAVGDAGTATATPANASSDLDS